MSRLLDENMVIYCVDKHTREDGTLDNDISCILEGVPTANAVVIKEGKWKLHVNGSGTCNQCSVTQRGVWDYDNWQNYCGHCGAQMIGVERWED